MNLIEAINTGLPFRRKGWGEYYTKDEFDFLIMADIIAEDWEVEVKKVTITEEDFNRAVARMGNLYYQNQWYWADALKKELGL